MFYPKTKRKNKGISDQRVCEGINKDFCIAVSVTWNEILEQLNELKWSFICFELVTSILSKRVFLAKEGFLVIAVFW